MSGVLQQIWIYEIFVLCYAYLKMTHCGCDEHGLEYIKCCVQKHVAPLVVFFGPWERERERDKLYENNNSKTKQLQATVTQSPTASELFPLIYFVTSIRGYFYRRDCLSYMYCPIMIVLVLWFIQDGPPYSSILINNKLETSTTATSHCGLISLGWSRIKPNLGHDHR